MDKTNNKRRELIMPEGRIFRLEERGRSYDIYYNIENRERVKELRK